MARKKKTRTIRRTVTKVVRRASKPYTPANLKGVAMGSALYGAVREDVSDMVGGFASNLPVIGNVVGTLGDEAVLGFAGYMMAKKLKNKNLRNIGFAAMAVESARIGQALRRGGLSLNPASSTNNSQIF